MKRLTARERMLLIIWVVVVAGFCLLIFLVKPMLDRSAYLTSEIQSQRRVLSQAKLANRKIKTIEKQIKELKAKVGSAGRQGSDFGPVALKELETLAADFKLRLNSIHPIEPTEDDGLRRYPFEFELEAPFGQLMEFIFTLETPQHSLFLERAELRPAHMAPGNISAKLRVAAFTPLTQKKPRMDTGKRG